MKLGIAIYGPSGSIPDAIKKGGKMRTYYIGRYEERYNSDAGEMVSHLQTYTIEADRHERDEAGGLTLFKEGEIVAEYTPISFQSWSFDEEDAD